MVRQTIKKWLGRWFSWALLGPVHVHGCALEQNGNDIDVILVPRRLGAADCWLFWSRLKRKPIFVEAGRFSDCWTDSTRFRRLIEEVSSREVPDRLAYWLEHGRTLVISLEVESRSAIIRLEKELHWLNRRRGALTVQLLTFNYDFRHTLGSPIHWIWRPEPLNLAGSPLNILYELQRLQKMAWSIKGHQTLPNLPLVSRSGRVPSSLLLSWHEVRAMRSWRWPDKVAWLWLPGALLLGLCNAAPLLLAFVMGHRGGNWRLEQQIAWLMPFYLINHLLLLSAAFVYGGVWGWMYLPLMILGVYPLGRLADRLIQVDDNDAYRAVRERMVSYFD